MSEYMDGYEEAVEMAKLPHASEGYLRHMAEYKGFSEDHRRGFVDCLSGCDYCIAEFSKGEELFPSLPQKEAER